jgi:ABC-type sulfate transport system substrate-binding protein
MKQSPAPRVLLLALCLLVRVAELGGWEALQKKHFGDGGVFDQIYARR